MKPETPTRTTRRVYDILTDSGINNTGTLLQIVVNNETLATHAEVLDLWTMRTEWLYSQSLLQHYYIDEREIKGGYIFTEWLNYVSRNGENLYRMFKALYAEYNPIDNYNMSETRETGVKQDKVTTKPTGKTTVTVTPYATGINSGTGDGAKQGKSTTETTFENAQSETTYTNTQTIDVDGETHSGYHHATEEFLKRSGNIGVTTSAQMIGQELDLRVVDLLSDFVKRFFDKYTYFVG